MRHNAPQATVHRKIWDSPFVKTVNDNKVLSGITTAGTVAALKGAAAQSDAFSKITEKAIIPAAGAALARVGGAAIEDAMINDWHRNKTRASGKLAAGTTAMLGGTQLIGMAYDIPLAKTALTGTLNHIMSTPELLVGAGMLLGGARAGQYALQQSELSVLHAGQRTRHRLEAISAATGGALAALAGVQAIGQRYDIPLIKQVLGNVICRLGNTNSGLGAAGTVMAGTALRCAFHATNIIKKGGNPLHSGALIMAAFAASQLSAGLVGNALEIPLREMIFVNFANALTGLRRSALGLAWASNTKKRIDNSTVNGLRGVELAAGVNIALQGMSAATAQLSSPLSGLFSRAASAGSGSAFALAAAGFCKDASRADEHHKPEAALFYGALAAASAVSAIYGLADGLKSNFIKDLGIILSDHTVEPILHNILAPTLQYLYQHPVAGSMWLLIVANMMINHRERYNVDSLFD